MLPHKGFRHCTPVFHLDIFIWTYHTHQIALLTQLYHTDILLYAASQLRSIPLLFQSLYNTCYYPQWTRARKHDIKVVPEPTKGSNTILSWSENPKTSLSIKSVGNWHGCGVRSLAERWYPVVTFAISHTSDGFFPSVLTRSLPFFLELGYFTFLSRMASKWNVYSFGFFTYHNIFSFRGLK